MDRRVQEYLKNLIDLERKNPKIGEFFCENVNGTRRNEFNSLDNMISIVTENIKVQQIM